LAGQIASYSALHEWSLADLDRFWCSIWEFFDVPAARAPRTMLANATMPGAQWMPGARLNYVDGLNRWRGSDAAIIARSQTRADLTISWDELHGSVDRVAAGLASLGVRAGDRVAAYVPNVPETVIAFLATARLGAIWSSCAPEFGVQAVVDRFSQIEPTVLLMVDGYRYGSKRVDRTAEAAEIRRRLPTVNHTVWLAYLDSSTPPGVIPWSDLEASPAPAPPTHHGAADHPLYVLYSSGTTGLPKPIVHGHGGILIEHLKVLGLHADLGPGDRFAWFTTTGWMMWNYLVSGLLVGSTIVLFDGDPSWPDLGALWTMARDVDVTWMGLGAPLLTGWSRAGLDPGPLPHLRAVGSTGAPLPPEGFRWVYQALGPHVMLSSISGGTDVCSAFVGGCPAVPVWEGEISCRYLGADVVAFDESGAACQPGEQGELVIRQPMPSMPVGLWNDDDGSRYRAAYFERFPGVWCHGDWVTFTDRGSCVISGRSDATLNRGGVRVGTAEIYRVVESIDGIDDSLVVHLDGDSDVLVLFVVAALTDSLAVTIRSALRAALSPRHVPDEIHSLTSIPTTLSGKKLELPVKKILLGADPDAVASRDALKIPASLDAIAAIARSRVSRRQGDDL
jgi:acetoacetyl-CoA synthetase